MSKDNLALLRKISAARTGRFQLLPALAALVLGGILSGCIASPTNGETVADPYAQIAVTGTGTASLEPIVVEALNQSSKKWETIGTTATGTNLPYHGAMGDMLPIYGYEAQVSIATREDPSSLCRWSPTCRADGENLFAQLRARQGSVALYALSAETIECLNKRTFHDIFTNAHECGVTNVVTIHLAR